MDVLSSKRIMNEYLSVADIIKIKRALEKSIQGIAHHYARDELIVNAEQETWMDTIHEQDTRQGARIEIQALHLALYNFLYNLTHKKEFIEQELQLKNRIHHDFWDGEKLADGLDDFTIRPNIFLAYYLYPDMLTNKEWKKCFQTIIPKLWLDWGGLATIDKSNPLFKSMSMS